MKLLQHTLTIYSVTVLLFSCAEKSKKTTNSTFKKEIVERVGYTEEVYSKVYKYYWVTKDTSDLKFYVYERKMDSTVLFASEHHKQIDFAVLLDSLSSAFAKINSDFDIYKIESLIFKQALYYPDLNQSLSHAYKEKYGEAPIDYLSLQKFLMSTTITAQLNAFLKPLNKKVKSYSIEKFHLLDKEQFSKFYPEMRFENYPDFTLSGSGIHVDLENVIKNSSKAINNFP